MADLLQVHPSYVQRDYVHGWLLSLLFSNSIYSDKLVLKGGNALRKGYFENSRYSRDIDFSTPYGINEEDFGRELNAICGTLAERAGVTFDTSRTRVEKNKRADTEKEISEARLYFKDFYGKESELILGVRLDITQFDRLYLSVQQRFLIHPYSDSDVCSASIRCVKLEEILATKMRCLLQRKHIADLFDLAYATIIAPEIEIDRSALLSTFFRITIFRPSPSVVKALFIDLPWESFRKFWQDYIACPLATFFDFERAKETFLDLLELLIPGPENRESSRVFFASVFRNPILQAANSMTMLRLTYDGVERLVEPYELAFKMRKDGIAREYFYAYDTVGGRSSGPGLKTFVPDKVELIANTDLKFEPRFPVEISKAGGAETVSKFEGKSRFSSFAVHTPTKPSSNRGRTRPPSYGPEYRVKCPYCGKTFKKTRMETKLNSHKDKYGNQCYGRIGYLV